jgi:hypothetical protein
LVHLRRRGPLEHKSSCVLLPVSLALSPALQHSTRTPTPTSMSQIGTLSRGYSSNSKNRQMEPSNGSSDAITAIERRDQHRPLQNLKATSMAGRWRSAMSGLHPWRRCLHSGNSSVGLLEGLRIRGGSRILEERRYKATPGLYCAHVQRRRERPAVRPSVGHYDMVAARQGRKCHTRREGPGPSLYRCCEATRPISPGVAPDPADPWPSRVSTQAVSRGGVGRNSQTMELVPWPVNDRHHHSKRNGPSRRAEPLTSAQGRQHQLTENLPRVSTSTRPVAKDRKGNTTRQPKPDTSSTTAVVNRRHQFGLRLVPRLSQSSVSLRG